MSWFSRDVFEGTRLARCDLDDGCENEKTLGLFCRFRLRIRKQRLRLQHPWHATPEPVLLVPAAGRLGCVRQFNEACDPPAATPRSWPWSRARHRERPTAAERPGQGQQREQQEEQRQRAVSSFATAAPVTHLRRQQPPRNRLPRDLQRHQVSIYFASESVFQATTQLNNGVALEERRFLVSFSRRPAWCSVLSL